MSLNISGNNASKLDFLKLHCYKPFQQDKTRIKPEGQDKDLILSGYLRRLTEKARNIADKYPDLEDLHLRKLGLQDLWKLGFEGTGCTLVNIDAGVDAHADLVKGTPLSYNQYGEPIYPPENVGRGGYRFAAIDMVYGGNRAFSHHDHGTYTAGIAASSGKSSANKHMGVAPDSNLIAIRVVGDSSFHPGINDDVPFNSRFEKAVDWCVENKDKYNIKVLSISVGSLDEVGKDHPLNKAVKRAWDAGILCVVAAGNDGELSLKQILKAKGNICAPGDSPYVLTVGGFEYSPFDKGHKEFYTGITSRGPAYDGSVKPDVLAPCNNMHSTDTKHPEAGGYFKWDLPQTSSATPVVAGLALLLFQVNPEAEPSQIKEAIMRTAKPVKTVYSDSRGSGRPSIQIVTGLKALAPAIPSPLAGSLIAEILSPFKVPKGIKKIQKFLLNTPLDKKISYLTPNDQGSGIINPLKALAYVLMLKEQSI